MIASLHGLVDSTGDDWLVLDVNGVGYLVYCSARTLGRLQGAADPVKLLIDMHVREDHIHLFGFVDHLERDWFRMLQSVQGVGAKVALAILSVSLPDELGAAIVAQDKATVSRANGVGPKLAARIVNELKDKVAKLAMAPVIKSAIPARTGGKGAVQVDNAGDVIRDAVSALSNLGYRPAEAYTAVSTVARELGADRELVADDLQTLIRLGLRELAS